jgi:uncharacterized protein YaiI (UPF0178 family)
MRIWIDADACPGAVRDIVIKAAVKRKIEICFVANKTLVLPESTLISRVQVASGPDVADQYILENVATNDLVVTQDIPLAHGLLAKGAVVINPRGEVFTDDNIADRLSIRDISQGLRDVGEMTGGPAPFGEKEKRAFASSFDRELTKLVR